MWIVIIFIAFIILGLIFGGGTQKNETTNSAATEAPTQQINASSQQPEAPKEDKTTEANTLTGPQDNAARSAKQYLEISGFSREGLIQQLSSSAGDKYDIADATAAVDSLNVDWNKQAARSAKQYLDMSGFSCDGLIEQLSSKAGDKYTASQAAYGAKQAGACS